MNELRMKYIVNQIEILHVILGLRNTPLRFQLSFERYFLLEKRLAQLLFFIIPLTPTNLLGTCEADQHFRKICGRQMKVYRRSDSKT